MIKALERVFLSGITYTTDSVLEELYRMGFRTPKESFEKIKFGHEGRYRNGKLIGVLREGIMRAYKSGKLFTKEIESLPEEPKQITHSEAKPVRFQDLSDKTFFNFDEASEALGERSIVVDKYELSVYIENSGYKTNKLPRKFIETLIENLGSSEEARRFRAKNSIVKFEKRLYIKGKFGEWKQGATKETATHIVNELEKELQMALST